MVTSSPELLAVSRRWVKSNIEGDQNSLPKFLSESEALRFLGSASGENWCGQDVRVAAAGYYQAKPEILHLEELFAEAFEAGDFGWSMLIHKITFAGRTDAPFEFRETLVFALEQGSWKIIQRHGSVPTPNQDIMGIEQTPMSQLAEAARQDISLGQTEGLASVMFTDVVASSVLANALGDRAWSAKINEHFAAVRSIIETHGGQFVKSLGDGTMSSFSSARSAMSAAREIQQALAQNAGEPRLSVRIGVHTGDVVQSHDDFFGSVVNTAARIASVAGRGEVFVSDVTRAVVGDDPSLKFESLGSHDLLGQKGPSVLHAMDWRS